MREMSTEPPSEEALRLGHQPDHFRVRKILWAGLGFAVLVVGVVIAMGLFEWLMTRWYGNIVAHEERRGAQRIQYSPSIDANQPQQLRTLREAEEAVLTSYAWQDEQRQLARVPIERAMAALAERGLPATLPGSPPAPADEAIPAAPVPAEEGAVSPEEGAVSPEEGAVSPDESRSTRPPAGNPEESEPALIPRGSPDAPPREESE